MSPNLEKLFNSLASIILVIIFIVLVYNYAECSAYNHFTVYFHRCFYLVGVPELEKLFNSLDYRPQYYVKSLGNGVST